MNLAGLRSVSLQQLRYLAAIAEAGSFTDAADGLGVSISALSQGVARLEDLLSANLFEADGRGRRFTDVGGEVASYAVRVLADTREMVDRVESHRGGSAGVLRVGMIDAAALYLATDSLDQLTRDAPGARLQLTVESSGALLQRLAAYEDDVAIVVGPASDMRVWPYRTEELYLHGTGDPATSPFVLYPTGSRTRACIDAGLRGLGLEPEVVAESRNPAVQHKLAQLSGALTVLPARVTGGSSLPRGTVIARREIVVVLRLTTEPSGVLSRFLRALGWTDWLE